MFARLRRLRLRHVRRLAPALVLLVAVGATVWLMQAWPNWQTGRLASAWREDLESVDVVQIPALVDQLVDLGDAGLEPLVTALSSPRPEVRDRAAAAVRRLVDNWEVADISARSAAAGRLSALLARHIDKFAPDDRQTAATLAEQLLVWTVDGQFVDRTQLVLDCETVLLAADAAGDGSDRSATERATRQIAPPPMIDRDLASLARLPGGGLTVEPSQPPRLPTFEQPPPTAPATDGADSQAPRLLLDGRGDELPPAPFPVVHPEDAAVVNPTSANVVGKNAVRQANNIVRDERADASAASADAPDPSARSAILLGPVTPREMSLVRLLQSEPSIADEAERQLRAIGYGDREIALAQSMSDPNVGQRLRLAESLPRNEGVRPGRWLEMMLDDDDPQVRLAAMTQLATSGDAALLESLRRRALADPDPTIRRQAERLQPTRNR